VIETDAPDRLMAVVELPHAQAFDLQRLCGDRQDAVKPIVEALAGVGVASRELAQCVALLDEPAFACGEGRGGRGLGIRGWAIHHSG
jgi:hypothetical protein